MEQKIKRTGYAKYIYSLIEKYNLQKQIYGKKTFRLHDGSLCCRVVCRLFGKAGHCRASRGRDGSTGKGRESYRAGCASGRFVHRYDRTL